MAPNNPEPEPPALQIKTLCKQFRTDRHVVDALVDVSLHAPTASITGLIGPDGAGKTTLMRLVAGLLTPDKGSIRVLDTDAVLDPLGVQRQIGYMPQRFGLYEDLGVYENLILYADLYGVPQSEREQRFNTLMHMAGLGSFESRLAGRLSGGMKQKLGLACTLLSRPGLLLLDEPTVGVDPRSRRELWQILTGLVEEEGMAVLLSTAYLDEAVRCNEVVLLHEGRVLGTDRPEHFRNELKGRTFRVRTPDLPKRTAQRLLADSPGVMDATIEGEYVRLLMKHAGKPVPDALSGRLAEAEIESVEPHFEDAFIDILDKAGKTRKPGETHYEADTHAGNYDEGTALIEVHRLCRRFGKFYAVREIDLEVYRGEVFGLLGANGAGKTTTFRMLCGLLPPTSGEISVAGVNLRHAADEARARIGYMSQKFALYSNLTVVENLDFFSSAYGLQGDQRHERIEWALNDFGLEDVADTDSGNLPLGFKQRMSLACALIHEPDILFLDEPTSGVDPLARRDFWQRINSLAAAGVTVMVTTHFLAEAEYCDRLAIMADGEILALDTPAGIKQRTRIPGLPEPTIEEAFISLIESGKAEQAA